MGSTKAFRIGGMAMSNLTQNSRGVLDELIDRETAAHLLGVSARTLDRWQSEGSGPARINLGRKVRYRRSSLEAWVAGRED
jgi:excisionase family DNA binding protein